ncbi:radical SAM protein [Poriferisphaera sp. WC338]|uniref:radical SAM protein n=1 Tax=Poriferisphaera sp. WC338 TaxID=3425129 RepID=UPI003D8185C1
MSSSQDPTADPLHVVNRAYQDHARLWESFTYVYPVISRRSGGLSIGINLNINKACNYDCIYCCVDRSNEPETIHVDIKQIHTELDELLQLVQTGKIWTFDKFKDVPANLRRLNDIAFSGDGEPTTFSGFGAVVRDVIELKQSHCFDQTKIVLITNATVLSRIAVQDALGEMMAHNGEIWAKLDAGTEAYYQLVNRTRVPLSRVLDNINQTAKLYPVIIQTMLMRVMGQPIPTAEFDTYIDRITDLIQNGSDVKGVQLYSVARSTAESYVEPVTDTFMDECKARLNARLPKLPIEVYYGVPAS